MKNKSTIFLCVALTIISFGVGFVFGMEYIKSQLKSSIDNFSKIVSEKPLNAQFKNPLDNLSVIKYGLEGETFEKLSIKIIKVEWLSELKSDSNLVKPKNKFLHVIIDVKNNSNKPQYNNFGSTVLTGDKKEYKHESDWIFLNNFSDLPTGYVQDIELNPDDITRKSFYFDIPEQDLKSIKFLIKKNQFTNSNDLAFELI